MKSLAQRGQIIARIGHQSTPALKYSGYDSDETWASIYDWQSSSQKKTPGYNFSA